jgi:hypothetical protein
MMRGFPSGINLVERGLLGTRFEQCDQVMSAVELLRRLRAGQNPPLKIRVEGLEDLLVVLRSKESLHLFRRTIADSANRLSQHGIVLIAPMTRLTMNEGPSFFLNGQHVPLAPVFGNRLQPGNHLGYFHAPFNIS